MIIVIFKITFGAEESYALDILVYIIFNWNPFTSFRASRVPNIVKKGYGMLDSPESINEFQFKQKYAD